MLKKFNITELKSKILELKEKIKSEYDRDAIIYTVLLVVIIGYGLSKFIFPALWEIPGNIKEFSSKRKDAVQIERKLKAINKPKEMGKNIELPVKIYESPYKDVELENSATGLINRIISLIKENGENKVESFEFETRELTDSSGLKSSNHSVLSLKIKMGTTYENLQNILNEIYLMEYLIKIKNVSLNSDIENVDEDTIAAYIILDLYIKTS